MNQSQESSNKRISDKSVEVKRCWGIKERLMVICLNGVRVRMHKVVLVS